MEPNPNYPGAQGYNPDPRAYPDQSRGGQYQNNPAITEISQQLELIAGAVNNSDIAQRIREQVRRLNEGANYGRGGAYPSGGQYQGGGPYPGQVTPDNPGAVSTPPGTPIPGPHVPGA